MKDIDQLSKAEGGARMHRPRGGGEFKPFFSIITITYNSSANLSQCLDSVLLQSHRDFELIVIDGGSSDDTLEVLRAKESGIEYYVSEPDGGIYAAINKGIALARGEVIGLIHGDDLLAFNALSRYRAAFSDPRTDIVIGDCVYFDDSGRLGAYKPARNYGSETIFRGMTGAHEAIFVRTALYRRVGTYDQTYRSAADFKLISAMVMAGASAATTGHVEVYKRSGGESFSREVEFGENLRLMRERSPHIGKDDYDLILKLKNYRDLSREDLFKLYDLIPSLNADSTVLRALARSLVTIMLGDGKTISFKRAADFCPVRRHNKDDTRVLFCISSIKGVSGGAERVMIDVAAELRSKGRDVLIGCADGKAGVPFYGSNQPVDLVDIFEPPYNTQLATKSDLQTELSDLVRRLPDEVLLVAFMCKDMRHRFKQWPGFARLCKESYHGSIDDIRNGLLNEIDGWLHRHGSRIQRWRGLINEFKPAIVVPFMISASTDVFIAARKTSAKVVISNHGNPIRDYLHQDDWDDTILDRALRIFAMMAAHKSIWLQEDFLPLVPNVAREKSTVLPNPVGSVAGVGAAVRGNVILGVGRLVKVKRFDILIQAFAKVLPAFPSWILDIYGAGPERHQLQCLIERLGIGEFVRLRRPTTEIFDVYRGAAFLVSCSEMEGFGLTVAEGLAAGLPAIVAARTSGLDRLVRHGHSGIIVDSDDLIDGFAKAMHSLMGDEALRLSMGANAQAEMSRFSIDKIADGWNTALTL